MKIGISCYPSYGGSGVVASELAMALAAGGDEVHVISYALPSRLFLNDPRLHYHEVVVPHYPLFEYPPYSLALATKMVEVARHQELDLMHVHYAVPNAVSAVLARQMLAPTRHLPVVTTLHGTDITLVGNDPNYLETTRFGILQSDGVTAVSQALKDATCEHLGISRDIDVIPNFIDPQRFSKIKAEGFGARRWAEDGDRLLVHISNFRPVKRTEDVIEIFARIRREVPCRLLMVGDGPERARVEKLCRDYKICHAITFMGNLPLIEEVLIGADLFLLPSENESFGLAALEALACGVPVIASDVGGLPEVVTEGINGFLRPVGDVDAMAEAGIELLQDADRHARFCKAARTLAVERFDQNKVVDQYREAYRKVL